MGKNRNSELAEYDRADKQLTEDDRADLHQREREYDKPKGLSHALKVHALGEQHDELKQLLGWSSETFTRYIDNRSLNEMNDNYPGAKNVSRHLCVWKDYVREIKAAGILILKWVARKSNP